MISSQSYSPNAISPISFPMYQPIISNTSESDLDGTGDSVSLGQQPQREISSRDLLALFQTSSQSNSNSQGQVSLNRNGLNLNGTSQQNGTIGLSFSDPTGTFENRTTAGYNNEIHGGVNFDLKNREAQIKFGHQGELFVENEQRLNLGDNAALTRQQRSSVGDEVLFNVHSKSKFDSEGVDFQSNLELGAKVEVKNTTTTGLDLGNSRLEWTSEQRAYAEAHAKTRNQLVVNKDELTIGTGFDVGAEVGLADKETLNLKTGNGSGISLSGEGSIGKGGSAKGGLLFSRKNNDPNSSDGGSTEVGVNLGGSFIGGFGGEVKVKIADADIDTALGVAVPFGPVVKALGGGEVLKSGLKSIPTVADKVAQAGVSVAEAASPTRILGNRPQLITPTPLTLRPQTAPAPLVHHRPSLIAPTPLTLRPRSTPTPAIRSVLA